MAPDIIFAALMCQRRVHHQSCCCASTTPRLADHHIQVSYTLVVYWSLRAPAIAVYLSTKWVCYHVLLCFLSDEYREKIVAKLTRKVICFNLIGRG